MILVFDIETNGYLEQTSKVHSFCATDIKTNKSYSLKREETKQARELLAEADCIVGHNILDFDIPAIRKVYGDFKYRAYRDTLILAQLRWPEITTHDRAGRYFIPKHLWGSHSLEAYGYRFGLNKGDFKGPWDEWSQEMQDYCEQDVRVTVKLYQELWKSIKEGILPHEAVTMEHRFAELMKHQEEVGVPFNTEAAIKLRDPLLVRIEEVKTELQTIVPPKVVQLKTKVKTTPFNPGSRDQIMEYLFKKYDWQPEKLTKNGNASLDEEVLESLPYPEAQKFLEYFQLQKLLGMLSEGDKSWLGFVKDGRIHGKMNTAGTVTARASHKDPNLGQIPSIRKFMGKEVRSLFYAPQGYKLVGIDASQLELRCLAHYFDQYDYGLYTDTVLTGDIHSANQKAAGLSTRDEAKTFIYALCYGAGDQKIGSIVVPNLSPADQKTAGMQLRHRFMANMPAYKQLMDYIKKCLDEHGYLVGIDNRRLTIRHKHAALNTLLQNAGAVAMKHATVIMWDMFHDAGIEAQPALNVHDENQVIVREDQAELAGQLGIEAIKEAGRKLGFKCPLDGAYRVGNNWSETH